MSGEELERYLAEGLSKEARKCILLCANCHAEIEAGLTPVPPKPLADAA